MQSIEDVVDHFIPAEVTENETEREKRKLSSGPSRYKK
jgi:hypothetical protein